MGVFARKKRNFLMTDTNFDSGSDNSDDNNVRELVPLLNNT